MTATAHVPYYSPLTMRAFELFFLPWRRRRLTVLPVRGMPASLPQDRPLVLIANHTSWWDGFLLRDMHRALRPGSWMITVMTEYEWRRSRFLRRIGGVPLDPASPSSVRRMLRAVADTCSARPDTTVVFFPQGRIWPAWRRPLAFRRGIELLLRAIGPCYVIPVGIHIEALTRVAPSVFMYAGETLRAPEDDTSAAALEQAVEQRLDAIGSALQQFGEDAWRPPRGGA